MIADALERQKKQKSTRVEFLQNVRRLESVPKEQEIAYAEKFCTIPQCSPKVVVLSDPYSAEAENFKILRAQILFSRNRKRPRSIMVTSTFPGEGKTFVAANLAVSLALGIEEYVLLVDCDLRRPEVHEIFGHGNDEGLNECLTGKKPLKDLVNKTQIKKLFLLTAGKPTPNPSELISSAAMRTFFMGMKNNSKDRFIVIDSAPSQIASETKVLAKYVDAIIFVVRAQRSTRKEIQRAINGLGKEKILGIVFNGYNNATKSYNKYYDKYYKR